MSLVLLSDESGDNGLSFSNGSSHFKVVCSILLDDNKLDLILNRVANIYKTSFLCDIKKWSLLHKKARKPNNLYSFLDSYEQLSVDELCLPSVLVIDKHLYSNPDSVNRATVEAYEVIYKRLLPFIRSTSYLTHYEVPRDLIWYIDVASDRDFINNLRNRVLNYANAKQCNIAGPNFIIKPKYLKIGYEKKLSTLISFVDVLAGISAKYMETFYLYCLPKDPLCSNSSYPCGKKAHYGTNPGFDCCSEPNCKNNMIECWKLIRRLTCGFEVGINGNPYWKWQALFYLPGQSRFRLSNVFGDDRFFQ